MAEGDRCGEEGVLSLLRLIGLVLLRPPLQTRALSSEASQCRCNLLHGGAGAGAYVTDSARADPRRPTGGSYDADGTMGSQSLLEALEADIR